MMNFNEDVAMRYGIKEAVIYKSSFPVKTGNGDFL